MKSVQNDLSSNDQRFSSNHFKVPFFMFISDDIIKAEISMFVETFISTTLALLWRYCLWLGED